MQLRSLPQWIHIVRRDGVVVYARYDLHISSNNKKSPQKSIAFVIPSFSRNKKTHLKPLIQRKLYTRKRNLPKNRHAIPTIKTPHALPSKNITQRLRDRRVLTGLHALFDDFGGDADEAGGDFAGGGGEHVG